jgi:hypothetical protein
VVLGLLLLALLGILLRLSVPKAQQSTPPRLSIVALTNGLAGKRMAVFNISNAAHEPLLFAPVVEVQTKGGNYERWAGGLPERPATALAAGEAITLTTEFSNSETLSRLRVIWQPKPWKMDYVYADGLDMLLRVFRRADYPRLLIPSARTWNNIVLAPEMLRGHEVEPAASPNAAPSHR